MNAAEAKERRKAWRAQARADLRRSSFWIFMACLYVTTFLLISLLMFILNLMDPYLPWIPKNHVRTDPPPLVVGFYCANLIPAMLVVAIPLLYIMVPFLSSKDKNNDETKDT
jgi:hypothetical protein